MYNTSGLVEGIPIGYKVDLSCFDCSCVFASLAPPHLHICDILCYPCPSCPSVVIWCYRRCATHPIGKGRENEKSRPALPRVPEGAWLCAIWAGYCAFTIPSFDIKKVLKVATSLALAIWDLGFGDEEHHPAPFLLANHLRPKTFL